MSTRAIRAEIALQKLDPTLPHRHCDKKGRLIGLQAVSESSAPQTAKETKKPEVEIPVLKNALVQLEEPIETVVETDVVSEETNVEIDATSTEETPKKVVGKKKKVVSTDL